MAAATAAIAVAVAVAVEVAALTNNSPGFFVMLCYPPFREKSMKGSGTKVFLYLGAKKKSKLDRKKRRGSFFGKGSLEKR